MEAKVKKINQVPKGYIKTRNTTTAPKGYAWYSNGISRFDKQGKKKSVLVKLNHNKMAKKRNMNKAPLLKRIEANITPGLKKMAKKNGGIALKIVSKRTGTVKNRTMDSKLKALPPGYRLSRTGRVYYETRRNRSDKARKRI